MHKRWRRMAILASLIAYPVLSLYSAGEPKAQAQKKVYQCIPLPGAAGAPGGGRAGGGAARGAKKGAAPAPQGDMLRSYLVKVDAVANNLALVFLADGLDNSGKAVVDLNGGKYQVPPPPGGLYAKFVIPLKADDLRAGLNHLSFLKGGGEAYTVMDAHIEETTEKAARVSGVTYLPVSAATNVRDFDFITSSRGVNRRKESELADWAQRGKFRFYRAGVDFNNLDRMFEMFKEGHFNFVMLQIPTPEKDSPDYKRYKEFFDRCHANGIKVMYDGGNGGQNVRLNAMTLEAIVLHPDWRSWIAKDEYGIARWRTPGRLFWTDVSNKAYRAECLRLAGIAMDTGADAAYFDWAIGNTSDLCRFFTELRDMTNQKKINWPMYGNCKGNILVEELCDLMKTEGTEEPGIWDGRWATNVSQHKFYYSAGFGWKPYESKYEGADPGSPNPGAHKLVDNMKVTWKLPMAEAWSFQSHWVIAEAGQQMFRGWVNKDNETAMQAWRDICQYNGFFDENQALYIDVRAAGEIALLAPPAIPSWEVKLARSPLYDTMNALNFMYDVVLSSRLNASSLAGYKTLVLADIPYLDANQVQALEKFKEAGGKILAVGSAENLRKLATATLPASILQDLDEQAAKDELKNELVAVSGSPQVSIQNGPYVIANLVKKRGTEKVIAHFVNYSQPVENMGVKLNLAGVARQVNPGSIKLLSPDGVSKQLKDVTVNGAEVTLTIPKLETYDVITVN